MAKRLDKLPDTLKADGYPDVQVFMATFRETEAVAEQYNRDLAKWEQQVKDKSRPPKPPEKESIRSRLRQLQEQGRQRSNGYLHILCVAYAFLLALRAEQREVFQFRICP